MMRKGNIPDRNGVMWCNVCRGQLKGKCIICRQKNSDIREEFPELVEHWQYIRGTVVKMHKFGMATTGVESVDSDCADYGLNKISTTPTAIIEERDGQFYAWLFANSQIFEIAETELLAKVGLAIKANAWQSTFSPNHRNYKWANNSTRKPMPLPNVCKHCKNQPETECRWCGIGCWPKPDYPGQPKEETDAHSLPNKDHSQPDQPNSVSGAT